MKITRNCLNFNRWSAILVFISVVIPYLKKAKLKVAKAKKVIAPVIAPVEQQEEEETETVQKPVRKPKGKGKGKKAGDDE